MIATRWSFPPERPGDQPERLGRGDEHLVAVLLPEPGQVDGDPVLVGQEFVTETDAKECSFLKQTRP